MHTKKININNQVHQNYENLIKSKKLGTRNILIDKKSCNDMVIYFNRNHLDESTTMLNLYYDKLIGKIEEYERKNT